MSSFFTSLATNFKKVEEELLGPDYKYYKFINTPRELGMSAAGNLDALANDVSGLISYTQLMIEGTGNANKEGGRPLGNKFFLKTGGECKDSGGGTQQRYIYVNNVPSGKIPFISSAMGQNFGTFRGLVPGTIEDVAAVNPLSMMAGFMQGTNPKCTAVSLPEINANNQKTGRVTHYIANGDISQMDPCTFYGGKNPVTKVRKGGCAEPFIVMNEKINGEQGKTPRKTEISTKDKNFANMYTMGVSLLLLFLLFRLTVKKL